MIAPAGPGLLDALAELEKECFSEPWSRSSFEACMQNPAFTVLADIGAGGTLDGYLVGCVLPPEAEVCNLAVRQDRRGQGAGRALMETFIRTAREKGCGDFYLEVRMSNGPARRLYESLGFRVMGYRRHYYEKPREDAIVMRLCAGDRKGEP